MLLMIPIPESQQRVHLPPGTLDWSEDEFFQFCQANRNLRIERTANGEIVVMSPAGGYSGYRGIQVAQQLGAWAEKDKTGVAFNSSTGFRLPNGAMRSPDAAWVRLSRLQELTHREKEQFIPLCPDFVIEIASPSDVTSALREKDARVSASGLASGMADLTSIHPSRGLRAQRCARARVPRHPERRPCSPWVHARLGAHLEAPLLRPETACRQ